MISDRAGCAGQTFAEKVTSGAFDADYPSSGSPSKDDQHVFPSPPVGQHRDRPATDGRLQRNRAFLSHHGNDAGREQRGPGAAGQDEMKLSSDRT
jgi:hypothetical protein